MAKAILNPSAKSFRGSIGKLIYREVNGQIIVSSKPRAPRRQSNHQRKNRSKFQLASHWAKCITRDPEKKAHYQTIAKELKLPNAYTAAIREYMRTQK